MTNGRLIDLRELSSALCCWFSCEDIRQWLSHIDVEVCKETVFR
jgi:hypothetical protein